MNLLVRNRWTKLKEMGSIFAVLYSSKKKKLKKLKNECIYELYIKLNNFKQFDLGFKYSGYFCVKYSGFKLINFSFLIFLQKN